MKVYFSW